MRLQVLPECFGTHEAGDTNCDGTADRHKPACRVRPECITLQSRCARTGETPQEIVASTHQVSLLRDLASEEGRLPPWRRRKRFRRPQAASPEGEALLSWFKQRLGAELKRRWAPTAQAPIVGEMTTRTLAQYVAVYVRRGDGPDVGVARVAFRRGGRLDIAVPVDAKDANRAAQTAEARITFADRDYGPRHAFRATATEVNRAQAAACARVIAALVRRGLIKIPPQEA